MAMTMTDQGGLSLNTMPLALLWRVDVQKRRRLMVLQDLWRLRPDATRHVVQALPSMSSRSLVITNLSLCRILAKLARPHHRDERTDLALARMARLRTR